ncbi:MAG: hypothetical protein M1838_005364 [Thelocarpon superellum]|nr:MAG: hypothetical protein M1838_005364 [Thelocarpon superellum]
MVQNAYVGQRLSFESALCTVRYIGPIQGPKGDWLGVEWDDPVRGKHNGQHGDVKYFECKSKNPTVASFVRTNRTADDPRSFLQALQQKYASEPASRSRSFERPIEWGGKVVEEVGFDKIRRQLATFSELRIVLLDGLCLATSTSPSRQADQHEGDALFRQIREICPKIRELDLSRNLLERWEDVVEICQQLDELKTLKISGNRFREAGWERRQDYEKAFSTVSHLELEAMLLSWDEITLMTASFPSLTTLSASSNELSHLSRTLPPQSLTHLTLENNDFMSIRSLECLSSLSHLQILNLRSNRIQTVEVAGIVNTINPVRFSESVTYVDLSHNAIESWDFIDRLQDVFPGMVGLRAAHNPLYDETRGTGRMGVEEGYMLTLARLGRLKNLNFSSITPQERQNAEMYYLSRIAKEAVEEVEPEEASVFARHQRYAELCEAYGTPVITRSTTTLNPNTLEARLIDFTFHRGTATDATSASESASTLASVTRKRIPRTINTYRLKGIVGRLFQVKPLSTRLIWETQEWDPVGGYDEDEDLESDGQSAREGNGEGEDGEEEKGKGKWTQREVELDDGTREIGFWIEGRNARVRVEIK